VLEEGGGRGRVGERFGIPTSFGIWRGWEAGGCDFNRGLRTWTGAGHWSSPGCKMAREGRQGLTPAYTAYRGLGSDSDGRRTGGKICRDRGRRRDTRQTEVARRLPGVHCRSARRIGAQTTSICRSSLRNLDFSLHISWTFWGMPGKGASMPSIWGSFLARRGALSAALHASGGLMSWAFS
jgi:hypothetical protein